MEFPALRGRSILVVEDEPLIGMDIRAALEDAGAFVTATTTVRHALILIEHDGLAGAIMDHALGDGDSTELCVRLKARGIPYVTYSGYDPMKGAILDAPHREQTRDHGHAADRAVRPAPTHAQGFIGESSPNRGEKAALAEACCRPRAETVAKAISLVS